MAARINTTSTSVTSTRPTNARLHLVGASAPRNREPEHHEFEYAGQFDPWVDPDRYYAANDDDWDYSNGNPINAVQQGQNLETRPTNAVGTYIRFRGVNAIGVGAFCSSLPGLGRCVERWDWDVRVMDSLTLVIVPESRLDADFCLGQ